VNWIFWEGMKRKDLFWIILNEWKFWAERIFCFLKNVKSFTIQCVFLIRVSWEGPWRPIKSLDIFLKESPPMNFYWNSRGFAVNYFRVQS
jgi:hypothetical protein